MRQFMNYVNILKEQFNNKVEVREKREGIYQLFAPFYHEDGDMIEIYLEKKNNGLIRISDFGMTVMRLSYSYDLDTEKKRDIFNRIIAENKISEADGVIYTDSKPENLYVNINQLTQTILKISNMRVYKRAVIKTLFYEMVNEFVERDLVKFNPRTRWYPIPNAEEYEVDFYFPLTAKPIFLFAVKDQSKARLVTISCLEFLRQKISFRSAVVYEDFNTLNQKDRNRILSATDKQFHDYDDFTAKSFDYFERELAA